LCLVHEQKCTLTGHSDRVRAVAYSLDGNIVSGSNDNTARIWDAQMRTQLTHETMKLKALGYEDGPFLRKVQVTYHGKGWFSADQKRGTLGVSILRRDGAWEIQAWLDRDGSAKGRYKFHSDVVGLACQKSRVSGLDIRVEARSEPIAIDFESVGERDRWWKWHSDAVRFCRLLTR